MKPKIELGDEFLTKYKGQYVGCKVIAELPPILFRKRYLVSIPVRLQYGDKEYREAIRTANRLYETI